MQNFCKDLVHFTALVNLTIIEWLKFKVEIFLFLIINRI